MTQPCRKDTTLNQQCCNRKHKTEGKGNTTFTMRPHTPHTPHTPPSRSPHTTQQYDNTHCAGQYTPPRFSTHHALQKREQNNARRTGDNTRGGDPTRRQGQHTPPLPLFNETTTQTEGGHHTQDGESVTLPPFTHHATHHPPCHPTIHDGPTLHHDEGGADRGYPTTRTAQTYTHPYTPHTRQWNGVRHDSSTR